MICRSAQWFVRLTDTPKDIADLVIDYINAREYEGFIVDGELTICFFESKAEARHFEDELLAEFPTIGGKQ